jgi:hypothetical protein
MVECLVEEPISLWVELNCILIHSHACFSLSMFCALASMRKSVELTSNTSRLVQCDATWSFISPCGDPDSKIHPRRAKNVETGIFHYPYLSAIRIF